MVLVVIVVVVVALLAIAALSDLRDRRSGHKLRSPGDIGRSLRVGKQEFRMRNKAAREQLKVERRRQKDARAFARKHKPTP